MQTSLPSWIARLWQTELCDVNTHLIGHSAENEQNKHMFMKVIIPFGSCLSTPMLMEFITYVILISTTWQMRTSSDSSVAKPGFTPRSFPCMTPLLGETRCPQGHPCRPCCHQDSATPRFPAPVEEQTGVILVQTATTSKVQGVVKEKETFIKLIKTWSRKSKLDSGHRIHRIMFAQQTFAQQMWSHDEMWVTPSFHDQHTGRCK